MRLTNSCCLPTGTDPAALETGQLAELQAAPEAVTQPRRPERAFRCFGRPSSAAGSLAKGMSFAGDLSAVWRLVEPCWCGLAETLFCSSS